MPEKEAILSDYELLGGFDRATLEEYLSRDGDITGYLFQCRHCSKYRLYADASQELLDMTKRTYFVHRDAWADERQSDGLELCLIPEFHDQKT